MFMLSFIDLAIVLSMFMLSFINHAIVLSMFMLLFMFVIVCGGFEWKQICAGFLSFVYTSICIPLKIQLSRGESWDPINRFNPTTLLCLFHARPGFPMA